MTVSNVYINTELSRAKALLQLEPGDDKYLVDREDEARKIITNLIEELQLNKNS